MATAFFLGRISDEIGRRVAIFAAVAISIGASLVFILADSLEMLFLGRLLSGLALPLASGAGTAWIVELCEDHCTAASLSVGAILSGLGLGALISGLFAEYSNEPLVFPFIALVSLALAAAVIVWLLPETVEVRAGRRCVAPPHRCPARDHRRLYRARRDSLRLVRAARLLFGAGAASCSDRLGWKAMPSAARSSSSFMPQQSSCWRLPTG